MLAVAYRRRILLPAQRFLLVFVRPAGPGADQRAPAVSATVTTRGRCPVCCQRRRVRKDGLLRVHYRSEGMSPGSREREEVPCVGSEKEPL